MQLKDYGALCELCEAWHCHPGTQNYAQMLDEQMAITFPPGSVSTGTDPGFHRRCKGHIFHHGGRHPIW